MQQKDNNNNNMQSNYSKKNVQVTRRDQNKQSMDQNNNNNTHGSYNKMSNRSSASSSSSSKLYLIASVMTLAIVIMGAFVPSVQSEAVKDNKQEQQITTSPGSLGKPVNQGPIQAMESSIANAKVKVTPDDMAMAAGHHHGKSHGKYYMYAESPKKGAYKMGFKRGNNKHTIERKESVHKSHVHSYFKWHDKKGKGEHKFEFKHDDHKKKKYHH